MSTNGHGLDELIAVERELPVRLTEAELLDRGDAMAAAELAIEQLKLRRRSLNASIAQEVERRATLAHTIESEHELRPVSCHWHRMFASNAWELWRDDTGEVVDKRPMTAADRQQSLALDAPPAPVEPAPEAEILEVEIVDVGPQTIETDGATMSKVIEASKRFAGKSKGKSKSKPKGKGGKGSNAHAD